MLGREPAVILGAIAEVLKAIIPMLIIFGILKWTPEQVAQVMLVVGVVVGSLTVILTRSQSVSTDKSDAFIKEAVKSPTGTPVEVVKSIVEAKS